METKQISLLMQMVAEHDISELEIIKGDETIRISRQMHVSQSENYSASAAEIEPATTKVNSSPTPKQESVETYHRIHSPMVGVFYRASSPNEKNFIDVGQTIKEGDPVCIIEAMKMLNQIRSDKSGVIKEILIGNGESVEYDQPIIVIE
jgi:acetyl-CoA carboxylase biotin carboxyl carrier protein